MIRERYRTPAAALFLFLLNAWITLPLFFTAYTKQMGSIEAAFIGLARYISEHFTELNWFPLWYGGIPFPDAYPPLSHSIVAAVLALTHVSPGLAYHFVTATVYAAAPAAFFWMVWRMSENRAVAFIVALGYSLVSPTCILSREVRSDAGGRFAARRLQTLVVYGEGPHLTSMLLLPIALGLLYLALVKRRAVYSVGAVLAMAGVALSNWLGAMALGLGAAALLVAIGPRPKIWLRAALLGAWAYAIALPWLGPSTIAVIRANAPRVGGNFESTATQKIYLVCVVLGFVAAGFLLQRTTLSTAARFALLFSFLTGITALGSYWFHLALVPQSARYHLEMDMAFWMAGVLLLWPLLRRIPARNVAIAAASIAAITIAARQHRIARDWEQPIDITTTIEYKSARWLATHMPESRVLASGSIGFWMAAFNDNPQLTGGFDNGILNPFVPGVIYQVYAGDNQKIMVDLLNAYGVDAVIAGGKDSAEVYHPVSHPEKLAGMTELWRDKGDAIYEIPRRSRSLAHTILPSGLVQSTPVAYDTTALQPYLAAIEDPAMPAAAFRWLGPNRAMIQADGLRPEHVFSVQLTWDRGWNAYVQNRSVRTQADRLHQMVVEPQCTGHCEVELRYDGGTEHRIASTICILGLGFGVVVLLLGRHGKSIWL